MKLDCGTIAQVQSSFEKPGMISICNAPLNKPFSRNLRECARHISSPVNRKRTSLQYVKALETKVAVASDVSSESCSQRKLDNLRSSTFPNGLESLVLEVCDKSDVAELKLKVGNFEMNLRRNIGTAVPIVAPSTLPSVSSKPMVESVPSTPSTLPLKPSPAATSPFQNIQLAKSSKLSALEGSGSNAYVLVSSPTVGSFRRGRTVKGKKLPPICKEGDLIKEGQTIGYLDQFGKELPVKSNVAGEVLKLLYRDGEAVGYGDPLIAVLPSFHEIE